MAKSFFEKLTGASWSDEEELENKDSEKKETNRKEELNTDGKNKNSSERSPVSKEEEKKEKEKKTAPNCGCGGNNGGEELIAESEGQLTIDVYQNSSEVVIKSTIAGVESNGIDINITSDMITIKGNRQKDEDIKEEDYYYQECYWGPFSRSVILPVDVESENAKATMKNGILTIRLPKVERVKMKKIEIQSE